MKAPPDRPEACHPGIAAPPLWLLSLIVLSGTLAMHAMIPTLPLVARDLAAGPGTMAMVTGLYMLGMAAGQLFYGPASDAMGRRPVLLSGLVLYVASGFAAAAAPSAPLLLAARLVQGIGGCAGLALGRAILRDTSGPAEAAGRMALMNLMVSVGPALAPLAGALMAAAAGWRSVPLVLALIGLGTLVLCLRRLPETHPRGQPVRLSALLSQYAGLLRSRAFLGHALAGACFTTGSYGFTTSMPFILVERLGRPVGEVGFHYAALIGGMSLGSVLANRLVRRVGLDRLLRVGGLLCGLGALGFLGLVLGGGLGPAAMLAAVLPFMVGLGLSAPLALTRSLSTNPAVIGSASGLYGFLQMVVGALCTSLAAVGPDPALASAMVLTGAALIGLWSLRLAGRAGPGKAGGG